MTTTFRFTHKLGSTIVTDTATGQVHEFATSDAAFFGRGRLEREHRAPVVTTPAKQRRLDSLAEKKQAGLKV